MATTLKIDFFKHSRAANSAVQGQIWLKLKLIQDVMVILVSSKNEEDPIKIEGARVATIQNIDFLNTKGADQLRSYCGAVTAKLICAFDFAHADCWFSHAAAQLPLYCFPPVCML